MDKIIEEQKKNFVENLYKKRDELLHGKISMLDVCPECCVDDFVHVENCNHIDLLEEFTLCQSQLLLQFIDSEIKRKKGMRISQDKAPKNSTESEKQNYDLGYAEALNDDIAHLQAIKDSLK